MKSFIIFKKIFKFHDIRVLNQDPCQQKELWLLCTYKSKGGVLAMYAQLDLEVIYKGSKIERRPFNFHKST
jgi:hypothetical protein